MKNHIILYSPSKQGIERHAVTVIKTVAIDTE